MWRQVADRAEKLARDSEVRRVALEGEVERLRARVAELEAALGSDQADAARARREAIASERELQRTRQTAAQRRREVDQALAIAIVGLRRVREEIDRVGDSKAWRMGHRLTRTANQLRFRRAVTAGAVSSARARVDQLLELLEGRHSASPGTEGELPEPDLSRRPDAATKRELAARLRDRLGDTPSPAMWPGVSVIVLNRNGAPFLHALVDGLQITDYPQMELIFVDHASRDGSVELVTEATLSFPVRVRRKEQNQGFGTSCNEAAELAQHDLLLFLSSDTEAFEPGWLKELVHALVSSERAAVGATLLAAVVQEQADALAGGIMIQQRAIRFERAGGLVAPAPVGSGDDPVGPGLGLEVPCVAASAACLLVRREAFQRVGGFAPGFRYGLEDVDLALGLAADGERVGSCGRSLLFHEGAATQRTLGPLILDENRRANCLRLLERWGPALVREVRLALTRRDPAWVGDDATRVVLACAADGSASDDATAHLGAALQRLGWRVSYLAAPQQQYDPTASDMDVLVETNAASDARRLPSWVIVVAWIRHSPERWLNAPWFDRYDILVAPSEEIVDAIFSATGRRVTLFPPAIEPRLLYEALDDPDLLVQVLRDLRPETERPDGLSGRDRRRLFTHHTYPRRADELRELIEGSIEHLSFCLKIGARDFQTASRGGDLYVAQDLARALKRRGHRCLIQVIDEWDEPEALSHDVVISIRGRATYTPKSGQFNVLWLISHPEELATEEANAYDLVCVASEDFAAELRQHVNPPVAVLEQATDPWRFYFDPDPTLAHDLVFVGNSRGSRRPLLDELLPIEADLAIWGSGLSESPAARHVQGEWFMNEELRRVYSSAKITLCDHWDDMRAHGFASNRLYDAVACGSLVVCDRVSGVEEKFGAAVVTYESAEELRALTRRLLSSDQERRSRVEGARERIMRAHTFDHRAAELLALIEQHAASQGYRRRIIAP